MQRKYLCAGLAVAAIAICGLAWNYNRSSADQAEPQAVGKTAVPSPLPIAQVILFNSGVGYFQREGEVSGDTRVDLAFPTSDINDLLKSLVLQDTGGGRVQAISYDSQDPIEKILRSFALDLNNNPTFGQILNQARGEKIEVMRQEKPAANPHKLERHHHRHGDASRVQRQRFDGPGRVPQPARHRRHGQHSAATRCCRFAF